MLTINIKGVSAIVTQEAPIVSGTIGMPIKFVFDSSWSALNKVAVYRYENPLKIADNKFADVLLTGTTEIESEIPANVLASTGKLLIGVCGTDGEDRTVTVFIKAKDILEGAIPSGFIPPHPDDLIDQVIEIAKKAPPYIGVNKHWYKFNTDTMSYEDTGEMATGPNEISTYTQTELNGIFKGNGTNVQVAQPGTDYVAPVAGKGLSENDYTDNEKLKVSESFLVKHSHENMNILNSITSTAFAAWNAVVVWVSDHGTELISHLSDTVKHITLTERNAWNSKSSVSVSQSGTATDEVQYITVDGVEKRFAGGGTNNFENLINRPKYNGTTMDKNTNIPSVPTKTSDLSNDSGFINKNVNDLVNYTKTSDLPSVPTKTSDLTNDSGFITKIVDDLTNYYLKADTYNKVEVNDLISAIVRVQFVVADTLPTASASTMNKIYLIPASSSSVGNVKDEYITIETSGAYSWEKIGNTEVDLSNYYTKSQTDSAIGTAVYDMATKTWVGQQGFLTSHQSLAGYATEAWVIAKNYITNAVDNLLNYYTKTESDSKYLTQHQDLSAYRTSAAQDEIDILLQAKTDNSLSTTSKQIVGAINEVNTAVGDKADTTALTAEATARANADSGKVDKLVTTGQKVYSHNGATQGEMDVASAVGVPIATVISSASTNSEVPSAKAVYDEINEPYELIETITLTEDTGWIDRSQDTNGKAYNFKKVKILCTLLGSSITGNRTVHIYSGSTDSILTVDFVTTSTRYAIISCDVTNHLGFTQCEYGNYTTILSVIKNSWIKLTDNITHIAFGGPTSGYATGTVIEIYGIWR